MMLLVFFCFFLFLFFFFVFSSFFGERITNPEWHQEHTEPRSQASLTNPNQLRFWRTMTLESRPRTRMRRWDVAATSPTLTLTATPTTTRMTTTNTERDATMIMATVTTTIITTVMVEEVMREIIFSINP
jgi:hypothetical protein